MATLIQGSFSGAVSVLDTGKWEWTDLSAAAAKSGTDKPRPRADTQIVYDRWAHMSVLRSVESSVFEMTVFGGPHDISF